MLTGTHQDITWLFDFARNWFIENPGQQVPMDAWNKAAGQAVEASDPWALFYRSHCVKPANYKIIPVLAAISLGFGSDDLAAVINHHSVSMKCVSDCVFEIIDETKTPDINLATSLSAWQVTSQVAIAMAQHPTLAYVLERDVKTYADYDDLEVACLMANNKAFWPITRLRVTLDEALAGNVDWTNQHPRLTKAYTFSCTTADLNEFSDEQVLTLLERSGHLSVGVTQENGFQNDIAEDFFNNVFLGMQGPVRNYPRIVQAINNIKDPARAASICTKLEEVLTQYPYENHDDGEKILNEMRKHLNEQTYGRVFNSMVMKLNILPIQAMNGCETLEKTPGNTVFDEFIDTENKVFERLYDELIVTAPDDFTGRHFKAIGTAVCDWDKPQDLAGVDISALVKTVLAGLDTYCASTHFNAVGAKTPLYARIATTNVEKACQFLAGQPGIDYSKLANLTSDRKAFLASNGFDIQKLPGMNRLHRGQVLSDQLGL